MAGILDHPDDAYAKLKQMGQGLFGGNGALNGLGGLGGTGPGGKGAGGNNAGSDPLGGQLGETLGNLIQQSLGHSRNLQPANPGAAAPSTPDPAPQPSPDSEPMKDVLKQLFNR